MTTRKLTLSLPLLGALLFAAAAHAGDYSMDAGGIAAEPGSGSSSRQADCASAGTSTAGGDIGGSGVRDSTRSSAAAATDRSSATVAGGASADSTPGGSSTSSEAIGAPIKARSNRWQSLVPGAIK